MARVGGRTQVIGESARLKAVQAPVIPIISTWIAETPDTISLGQGIVSYGPPAAAIDAARHFGGAADDHRYGPVEGLPVLVDAFETKLRAENGIVVQPESRTVITAGSNLAFMNAILAITDPGDEVILQTPFYFNHDMAIVMAGAVMVPVPTTRAYQLDLEAIAHAITPRTRAVVTVSPNNPTGVVYDEASLRAVNELCRARGVFHIHDEAYEYFTYGGVTPFSPGSIAGAAGHTISLFSLSKAYGMASWRIGAMIFPASLWDAINKIQDTILICATHVSQAAAVAALRTGRAYTQQHLPALDAMRRHIFAVLDAADVPCDVFESPGAFYYFLKVHTDLDSMTLAERLVREHRVAAIPGIAFGMHDGCYLRISYGALDGDRARDGLGRLVHGLRAIST